MDKLNLVLNQKRSGWEEGHKMFEVSIKMIPVITFSAMVPTHSTLSGEVKGQACVSFDVVEWPGRGRGGFFDFSIDVVGWPKGRGL